MRHDWTLLCTEVEPQENGTISLGNVFATSQVTSPLGNIEQAASLLFDPPAILVSHWTAEFEVERCLHSATVQLMAPGGDRVLWRESVEIDFLNHTTIVMTLIMQNMPLTGMGTYEFHMLLEEYASIGEWGRASFTISEA